jgi:uncharacterized protein (DUF1015 family)
VSLIKPFRALRPAPDRAKEVSSVPYDVYYESEVRDFVADNPSSFLRVTRPEVDASDPDGIENARRSLQDFVDTGILVSDPEPAVYVYRLTSGSHSQTGVVACCSLDEYESGLIKEHEKTRPDKVEDRTRHMLALRAQTGLIFLAYRGSNRIYDLVAEITAREALYDFECRNGIRQTVWRVTLTEPLIEAFEEVPALYVADGHHRLESASHARNELRSANPGHTGNEDYNYVLAGLFPAEELKILAYNRVVKDLNGMTNEEFLAAIQQSFVLGESTPLEPQAHGEICMYLGGKWYDLLFAVNYFREPDPIDRLDVSILQQYILEPILGITDIRTDKRISFVGGIRGTAELERMVDSGEARVAFSLYPTTMDDLFAVSDMGEIMPPKSTWFEPKLKDGLFVHLI